jgi:uncharacterized protein YuzE
MNKQKNRPKAIGIKCNSVLIHLDKDNKVIGITVWQGLKEISFGITNLSEETIDYKTGHRC